MFLEYDVLLLPLQFVMSYMKNLHLKYQLQTGLLFLALLILVYKAFLACNLKMHQKPFLRLLHVNHLYLYKN